MINDIDKRLEKNEWNYLIEKYPHVAFNYKHFNGSLNNKQNGFDLIYIAEPYITMPEQWDYNLLKQYEGVITYNRKFYNDYKNKLNMKVVSGCLACNAYYQLDSFKKYDERIVGACILNKLYGTGRPGDIVSLRQEIVNAISSKFPVHVWSQQVWGGRNYKGNVNSPIHHSHISHLTKINEYMFCICFESSYHEYWSWDFITERMFNCFKSKTIPIYIGCYNIEEHVPKKFFIDFRDFRNKYDQLVRVLSNFPKTQWEDMTESAYEWNKTNRIGNVEDLENTIGEFK